MTKNKKIYYLFFLLGIIHFQFACQPKTIKKQPNILLIMADDLGFDDLSLHGNRVIETPFLDELGRQSKRFEQFYVQSVCAPTRASLLTGQHFWRTGVSGVHGGRDFMRRDVMTLGEALQAQGYRTGTWGKWHSGKTAGYFPWERGFDEAYMSKLYRHAKSEGLLNGKRINPDAWDGAACVDMALDFMTKNKEKPFFAYLPMLAPHEPWEAPASYIQKYKAKGLSDKFATLAGMIEHLDFQVGRLLQGLEEKGLKDNTYIIFLSDNGPWWSCSKLGRLSQAEWDLRNPSRLRGNKGTNWENGIKAPLFVSGPGIAPGLSYQLAAVEDLYPTLLQLAGGQTVPGDGTDLSAHWLEDVPIQKTHLIAQWNFQLPQQFLHEQDKYGHHVPLSPALAQLISPDSQLIGLRTQRYKLLLNQYGPISLDRIELHDMYSDLGENRNWAKEGSQSADSLQNALLKSYKEMFAADGFFQMPTFYLNDSTDIMAFAPQAISPTLYNLAHALSGWQSTDQWATYALEVQKAGDFQLELIHDFTEIASMQLDLNGQTIEFLLSPSDLTLPEEIILEGNLHASTSRSIKLDSGRYELKLKLNQSLQNPQKLYSLRLRQIER